MNAFSPDAHLIGLSLLAGLVVYTVWLLRSGRLSPHMAVRWILAEGAACAALALWPKLPFFRVTSAMDDRELLILVAIVFFVLVSFLMLDSLSRLSTQSAQIKRLTQELALLREQCERMSTFPSQLGRPLPISTSEPPNDSVPAQSNSWSRKDVSVGIWAFLAVAFFICERQYGATLFPSFVRAWLTADYLK